MSPFTQRELAEQDGVLVHGIVTGRGPLSGHRFVHAWVETRTSDGAVMVHDHSNGNQIELPALLYYALGNIDPQETVRYSAHQARGNLVAHGHYGPWEGAAAAHENPTPESLGLGVA